MSRMSTKNKEQILVDKVKEALFLSHARGEGPLNEDLLAEQFKVSRTPVREALKKLQQEGIIERRQKKGIVLRKFTSREIRELYDIRKVLEVYAFGLASERATEKNLQFLRKISRRHDAAIRQGNMWLADILDMQFHAGIIDIAANLYLIKLVKTLHLLNQAFQISTQLVDRPQMGDQSPHDEIIEALAQKNPARGILLLKRHIENSKRKLLKITGTVQPLSHCEERTGFTGDFQNETEGGTQRRELKVFWGHKDPI